MYENNAGAAIVLPRGLPPAFVLITITDETIAEPSKKEGDDRWMHVLDETAAKAADFVENAMTSSPEITSPLLSLEQGPGQPVGLDPFRVFAGKLSIRCDFSFGRVPRSTSPELLEGLEGKLARSLWCGIMEILGNAITPAKTLQHEAVE